MQIYEISLAIGVMAVANFLTRVSPFLFFRKREMPRLLKFFGDVFPGTIMIILVLYSVSGSDLANEGTSQVVAILVTLGLHLMRNNYLLSILGGTIFYMVLVQYGGLS